MAGFIVFLVVAVALFFVVRQKKRHEAIERLKNGGGYKVAVAIKDELSSKGYKIDELSTYFFNGGVVGNFYVYFGESGNLVGYISFSKMNSVLWSAEFSLRKENMELRGIDRYQENRYYAIENANINLLVRSKEKSQAIPPFIEIAADVIRRSEYAFKHPDWLNEHPEAKQYLNVMFQYYEQAWVYYSRGVAYGDKGDYDRAIADCTKAIELDPKFVGAYNSRGLAYNNKGDYDRAIVDCTKAIELDPKFIWAYNNRGVAYNNKGDYDRAIVDYTEALRIDPDSEPVKDNLEIAKRRGK